MLAAGEPKAITPNKARIPKPAAGNSERERDMAGSSGFKM
jgi:hypothetical protein